MKNVTILSLLLIFLHAGNSFAQGSGSSSAYGSRPRLNDSSPTQNPFEITSVAKGNIVRVDGQYITLKTKRNRLITVRLSPATSYKKQKEEIVFQELVEGQFVKVTYRPKESVIAEDRALTVSILK